MGQPAFSLTVNFESITCSKCGIPFAAPEGFFSERRDDHQTFHCVSGHPQYFPAKTDAEKLRELLAAETERKIQALNRANAAEQLRAKAERKLKRVSRGTCPECNRSFQNLARHMACKHAESV